MAKNPTENGYKKWKPENIETIKKACTVYLNGVVKPKLVEMLREVASEIVAAIDGGYIPVYLGHLHDATGVAVYVDGVLSSYMPTAIATKRGRSGYFGVNNYNIVGHEYLANLMADASTQFSMGIWIVVLSAVPYAYFVNENGSPVGRGQGFFDQTVRSTVEKIISGLRPITSGKVNLASNISQLENLDTSSI
jgi:hypothetical protein